MDNDHTFEAPQDEIEFSTKYPIVSRLKTPKLRTIKELLEADNRLTEAFEKIDGLVVVNQEANAAANELFLRLRKARKDLTEKRQEFVAPYKKYTTQVEADFRLILELIEKAETSLSFKTAGYRREMERKAAEEKKRIEQEQAQRKEEEEKGFEEERKLAEQTKGDVPPVALPLVDEAEEEKLQASAVPKVTKTASGTVYERSNWIARVQDLKALVDAVAAGTAPLQCLQADTQFLNQKAKLTKGASPYAGVIFEDDPIKVGRSN